MMQSLVAGHAPAEEEPWLREPAPPLRNVMRRPIAALLPLPRGIALAAAIDG
jgi:hypothetical protein